MKLLLSALVICLTGCADLEMSPEARQAFLQNMQQQQYQNQQMQLQYNQMQINAFRPPQQYTAPSYTYTPPAYIPPTRPINCTSTRIGQTVQTYCN